MKLSNKIFVTNEKEQSAFIAALQQFTSNKELPVDISYKLIKVVKEVNDKAVTFKLAKESVYRKYGKEKEGIISIDPKKVVEVTEEMNKLYEIEEEYNFEPVELKLEDLKKYNMKMSAEDLIEIEEVIIIKE